MQSEAANAKKASETAIPGVLRMRPAPIDSVLGLVRFSSAPTPFPPAETRNPPTPLAAPSSSSPHIGVQNLSPAPVPPCLQWVTPFQQSWLHCGSRILGCPSLGARQIVTAPVSAPGILGRQTRGEGRRGLLSPFPGGSGRPWRRRCPERSSRS